MCLEFGRYHVRRSFNCYSSHILISNQLKYHSSIASFPFFLRFVPMENGTFCTVKVRFMRENISRVNAQGEKFEGSVSLLPDSKKFYFCVPRPNVRVFNYKICGSKV